MDTAQIIAVTGSMIAAIVIGIGYWLVMRVTR